MGLEYVGIEGIGRDMVIVLIRFIALGRSTKRLEGMMAMVKQTHKSEQQPHCLLLDLIVPIREASTMVVRIDNFYLVDLWMTCKNGKPLKPYMTKAFILDDSYGKSSEKIWGVSCKDVKLTTPTHTAKRIDA
ncbi:hypothetical protein VPH35_041357 [Triticum aestivum]|uniref:Uncharacterized protein n=1 Tax=Aegilops tauschii TaxID=37682 RepID=M8BJ69_AEGTA